VTGWGYNDSPEQEAVAAQPPEPLHLINPANWQDLAVPQRRWIVPDWIPIGAATGLYGPPGHGKTLIVQQLMTARAVGKPWLGCSVVPGRSIAFLCEDDEDELHRRQEAINCFYGCNYRDLGDFIRFVPRLGHDNTMMTFKDGRPLGTPFYHQAIEEALRFGADLVIVDTVADTFGGNQNDMGQVRAFVQFGLAGIARNVNGASLACAHPSQYGKATGSGESGSVQWDAGFRSRGYLNSPKPNGEMPVDGERILTRVKANYASRNETIELVYRDGVYVTKYAPTGILASITRKTCERVFGDMLDRLTAEGQRVSHNPRAGNYAPRIFALRPDREGFKRADFERAMHTLFANKQIKVAPYTDVHRNKAECIVRYSA
jgi:RecA-family ATPase